MRTRRDARASRRTNVDSRANGRRSERPADQPASAGGGGAAPTSGGATGGGRIDGCVHARGRASGSGRHLAKADVSECIVSKAVECE
ncbi:hypothetical protein C6P97_24490 [Burkholderia multivorans]|uniref:Uncharacterized protein n=1 Tax=Burkholderia multivorans TaxID=87883 RepID=A0AB37AN38_9BURK|nr:hypothetical protein C6P99_28045 [Burkholderia multivorans]PRE43011.1 hypothetical protein C6P97_24490 [Burkholderia multivorans]